MATPRATFADKPTLTGEWVVLRPFEDADLAEHPDLEVLRRWYTTRNEQVDRLDLAVVDRSTGGCVGEVVLNEWEPDNLACNFRILLGPDGRDRGLGTEATRLVVDHALDALGLHRVSLEVYAFNPRAQRAYEKAGFVVEGVRRDALRFDGVFVDAVVMSRLATDPR